MTQSRRRGGRRISRGLAVGVPVFIFSLMAMIAIGGLVAVVAVFAAYSADLPPTSDLNNLEFISESVVYDRTGRRPSSRRHPALPESLDSRGGFRATARNRRAVAG